MFLIKASWHRNILIVFRILDIIAFSWLNKLLTTHCPTSLYCFFPELTLKQRFDNNNKKIDCPSSRYKYDSFLSNFFIVWEIEKGWSLKGTILTQNGHNQFCVKIHRVEKHNQTYQQKNTVWSTFLQSNTAWQVNSCKEKLFKRTPQCFKNRLYPTVLSKSSVTLVLAEKTCDFCMSDSNIGAGRKWIFCMVPLTKADKTTGIERSVAWIPPKWKLSALLRAWNRILRVTRKRSLWHVGKLVPLNRGNLFLIVKRVNSFFFVRWRIVAGVKCKTLWDMMGETHPWRWKWTTIFLVYRHRVV